MPTSLWLADSSDVLSHRHLFCLLTSKNPETTKHFGIFNINKVWRLLYHDLLTISDIDALTRLSNSLALKSEPLITLHFSTFHFFNACRAVIF